MATCPACGSRNRPEARFCFKCATVLKPPPGSRSRPDSDDQRWLAATLNDSLSSLSGQQAVGKGQEHLPAPSQQADSTVALDAMAQEEAMEQSASQPPLLFGGRYELVTEPIEPGSVEVIDRQPWRCCWACGATSSEEEAAFCENCGAALEQRHYRGILYQRDEPDGPALIARVADETSRQILPFIWDEIESDEYTLLLLRESGQNPVTLPLDDISALRVGIALAELLAQLHAVDLKLGRLKPGQIELAVTGQPHLRDVPELGPLPAENRADAIATDLIDLAHLLEALTATPRTTRRLEADVDATDDLIQPMLADVLRDVRTGTIADAAEFGQRLDALLAERTRPFALFQRIGSLTDTGIVRDHNEDSLLALDLTMENSSHRRSWGLYIVADGMGGHAAGEVASGLAIRGAAEAIMSEYLALTLDVDASFDHQQARDAVQRAIVQANHFVLDEGRQRGNDMGSTLTMALVVGDRLMVGNVGDSRTYLLRDGRMQRISQDHSLVMRLVELGQIREEDIYTHPQRNAVLRSLGDKDDVEVDVFSERLQSGDALLLCSDGQWEMTHDAEMEQIIAEYDDPQQACQALIAAANQAGGEDNISAILVRFD
jgi:protein phosphatase